MMTLAAVAISAGSKWLFALAMCLDTVIVVSAIVTFGSA